MQIVGKIRCDVEAYIPPLTQIRILGPQTGDLIPQHSHHLWFRLHVIFSDLFFRHFAEIAIMQQPQQYCNNM